MLFHDLLRDGEPEPRSAALGREVGVEEPRKDLRGHARAVVFDRDHDAPSAALGRQPDAAAGSERLDRVSDEIRQQPREQPGIAEGSKVRRGLDGDAHPRSARVGGRGLVQELFHGERPHLRPREPRVVGKLGGRVAQGLRLPQHVLHALLQNAIEVGRSAPPDLAKMFDREADGSQRILDLVGDDPRHLGPGRQPIGANEVRHVLDDRHPRTGTAQGQRYRDHAPSLAGARLELGRLAPAAARERASQPLHRIPGKDVLEGLAAGAPASELGGRGIGEEHGAVVAVGHDTGGQLGEKRGEAFLLARQRVGLFLQASGHVEKSPDELPQLFVRRLRQLRGEVSPRHGARPLDEIRDRSGNPHGEPARDRRRDQEDQQAERGDRGGQLRGLRLRDALLRQQEQRQQAGASHSRHSRQRRELGRDLLEAAPRDEPGVDQLARRPETDRRVRRPGHALREQAGRIEVAARRRDQPRLRGVHGQVVAHRIGEPGQQRVVDQAEPAELGLGGRKIIVEHPARRVERGAAVIERVAPRARGDRGPQEERHRHQRHHHRKHEERHETPPEAPARGRERLRDRTPLRHAPPDDHEQADDVERRRGHEQLRGGEQPLEKPRTRNRDELEPILERPHLALELLAPIPDAEDGRQAGAAHAHQESRRELRPLVAADSVRSVQRDDRARRLDRGRIAAHQAPVHREPLRKRIPRRPVGDLDDDMAPSGGAVVQRRSPAHESDAIPIDEGRGFFRAAGQVRLGDQRKAAAQRTRHVEDLVGDQRRRRGLLFSFAPQSIGQVREVDVLEGRRQVSREIEPLDTIDRAADGDHRPRRNALRIRQADRGRGRIGAQDPIESMRGRRHEDDEQRGRGRQSEGPERSASTRAGDRPSPELVGNDGGRGDLGRELRPGGHQGEAEDERGRGHEHGQAGRAAPRRPSSRSAERERRAEQRRQGHEPEESRARRREARNQIGDLRRAGEQDREAEQHEAHRDTPGGSPGLLVPETSDRKREQEGSEGQCPDRRRRKASSRRRKPDDPREEDEHQAEAGFERSRGEQGEGGGDDHDESQVPAGLDPSHRRLRPPPADHRIAGRGEKRRAAGLRRHGLPCDCGSRQAQRLGKPRRLDRQPARGAHDPREDAAARGPPMSQLHPRRGPANRERSRRAAPPACERAPHPTRRARCPRDPPARSSSRAMPRSSPRGQRRRATAAAARCRRPRASATLRDSPRRPVPADRGRRRFPPEPGRAWPAGRRPERFFPGCSTSRPARGGPRGRSGSRRREAPGVARQPADRIAANRGRAGPLPARAPPGSPPDSRRRRGA